MVGTVAALLAVSSPSRAEKPAAWRGPAMLQLTAAREALSPSSARTWGLSYSVDEAYAGPWANSPLSAAAHATTGRALVNAFERAPAPALGSSSSPSSSGASGPRGVESIVSRLGPLSMLASVVIPAMMGSSSSIGRNDVTPRVGFARFGRGYGVMLTGRFY